MSLTDYDFQMKARRLKCEAVAAYLSLMLFAQHVQLPGSAHMYGATAAPGPGSFVESGNATKGWSPYQARLQTR